ncbi:MAG: hypothetical protein GTN76_06585 [Candidatus Aenigmarchaeota archaeon]|nr:hypothetical protein [Candidatus Aenigmarchaeota archaeon]
MVEIEPKRKVLLISLIVGLVLISGVSVITQDIGAIINVGVICLFIVVTPFFVYNYLEFLWLKAIEREIPNFIRDLASLKRSGMTLSEAVKMTSKTNYGKLSDEVQKFSNRLSWGIPFIRSLEIFSNRFKNSKLISEVLGIVRESYMSGGDVSSTLDSLSKDMLTLRDVEEERKSIVRQHVMIMYGIFFMFVGISLAIINVLIPMMIEQPQITGGEAPLLFSFTDPCTDMPIPFPCDFFNILCVSFNIRGGIACYYIALFFSVLIVQAIFMGLIAGQLGENSAIAGVKHSLIMLASIFVIFMFVMRLGLLPI